MCIYNNEKLQSHVRSCHYKLKFPNFLAAFFEIFNFLLKIPTYTNMAYVGRYIDRSPCKRAAGVVTKLSDSAADTLRTYPLEEMAEGLFKEKCRSIGKIQLTDEMQGYPYLPQENQIKDLLSTELKKSRFVAFREKFSEDMYFKKPELGKSYPIHSKPDEITNLNTTFGKKLKSSGLAYDIILPRKPPDQVNREYAAWHDKYVLSHKHYFPSERINRHYNEYFNPKACFGIKFNADTSGKHVRRCLTECNNMLIISKVQKDFMERTVGRLGRRKNSECCIESDVTYGSRPLVHECDAKGVIENLTPCCRESELAQAISHINRWRRILFNRVDFHMYDLKLALKKRDVEGTGFLPLAKIVETARKDYIYIQEDKMRAALRHFNLLEDEGLETERVNYIKFWRLLHIQIPMPKVGAICAIPDVVYNKETTYRALCDDREKPPIEDKGWEQRRSLRDFTTVKDVISPDIPTHFGLVPNDFDIKRDKEEMRTIFKQIIIGKNFENVWQRAIEKLKREEDAFISVNELRAITLELKEDVTGE